MATYLIVTGDNPNFATRVEAKHLKEAIETLDLEDGDKVTVYRIASEPKTVTVKTETIRKVVVE